MNVKIRNKFIEIKYSAVEGQEARCYVFYFFESVRGRDYFLSSEK